ncbi:MAG TPA: acyl carrier protein [Polyangiaceae bacterium]|jgi:acyl carrier protein|nr:acyl carrier protein [Polyangiaceae bacterium]
MALTREGLVDFMKKELGVKVSKITDASPLFSAGVIDSHMLLQLITYIEGVASIHVGAGDLSLENFDSIERMLAFVATRVK